jgi:hypothetical protein
MVARGGIEPPTRGFSDAPNIDLADPRKPQSADFAVATIGTTWNGLRPVKRSRLRFGCVRPCRGAPVKPVDRRRIRTVLIGC